MDERYHIEDEEDSKKGLDSETESDSESGSDSKS